MIDIMLNDRFYAAFRYKYCPAFKFDIEDMTNKVYERYPTLRKRAMNGEKVVFADLKVGDYVVHKNYGIGLFVGVNTITADGTTKDYIKIKYKNPFVSN